MHSPADGSADERFSTELRFFLEELNLGRLYDEWKAWCDNMGASFLDEIVAEHESFSEWLSLKPLERKRVAPGEKSNNAIKSAEMRYR